MKDDTEDIECLRDLGERRVIERLLERLRAAGAAADGIGDDCAVLPGPGGMDWILASDPVIEGVHFESSDDRRAVGHKAVGRLLSDFAAMGAEPLWLLVDLVAPGETPMADLEALYDGASALLSRHGVLVVGGDVAAGPVLELHAAGVGRVPAGTAMLRGGGHPGDRLFVTGGLGYSRGGRHLAVEPRLAEGRWLREGDWATAAIDVSDGLLSDAMRLAEMSGVAVDLLSSAVPCREPAGPRDGRSPLEHALQDGEDHELLFCVPEEKATGLQEAWTHAFDLPCTCIGRLQAGTPRVLLDGRPAAGGYEHFVQGGKSPLCE